MTRREELQERYEDALFALLMDDIATAQGKEAEDQNEQLKNDPTFEIPEEVDQRCLQTIRQHSRKQQLHVAGRVTWKVLKTAIVAAGIAALLFTGAFAASETVRVNTINLIVEVFGTNTVFQFESQANGVTPAIRVGWVPDGFALESYGGDTANAWYQYINSEGALLYIDYMTTSGSNISVDTEDAEVDQVNVHGEDAILVIKEEEIQLAWPVKENSAFIGIVSLGIDRDDLIRVADSLEY